MTGPEGTLPAGVRPLIPGDPPTTGGYPLLGRLGSGGMGVVYLGHHPDHGLVAVKLLRWSYLHQEDDDRAPDDRTDGGQGDDPLRPDTADLRRRFRAEVEFARRVASCATARVIEDGTGATRPYIVTEYIQGPPLHDVVDRQGPLPSGTLEAVALGVSAALVAIHRAGLIHRDLKPANLLLSRHGPRVIDFGLATDLDVSGGPTLVGVIMGSPGWIAPERLHGFPATAASDLFGWGCLVAYAGTGRHPFGVGGADEITARIMHGEPDLTGLAPTLRGPVAAALSKDPESRPTAAELLRMLLVPLLQGQALAPDDDVERIAATMIAKIWRPPADPAAESGEPRADGYGAHGYGADGYGEPMGPAGGGDHARSPRPVRRGRHTRPKTLPRFAAGSAFGWTAAGWTTAAAVLVAAMAYGLDAGGKADERPGPGPDVVASPTRPVRSGVPGENAGANRGAPGPQEPVTPLGSRSSRPTEPGRSGSAVPSEPVSAPPVDATTSPPASVPPGKVAKSKRPRPNRSPAPVGG